MAWTGCHRSSRPTTTSTASTTAFSIPRVDVNNWQLSITGLVERPYSISFDELLGLSTFEEFITLCCVSNEVGGNLIGNAKWQGVPIWHLINHAGVKPEATQIVGRSVDGFTVGFPRDVAFDGRPALVAVGMNGEALPFKHGFPARLIVSGLLRLRIGHEVAARD